MNIRVFALTVSAFCVGLLELIIGGILPQIAEDFNVSISKAGLLITVYSICYAIAGPLLLSFTSKFERKTLLLYTLAVFTVGSALSAWSPTFAVLMLARVVCSASGALIIVIALSLVLKAVAANYQARAIGFVSMGISSSIVIGIPIGVLISDWFNWRAVFVISTLLSILAFIITVIYIKPYQPTGTISLKEQFKAIKSVKIISAHSMMILSMGGHYVLYSYLTPYLQHYYQFNASAVSIIYFIFGFSAITGGYVGGMLADKIGPKRAVLSILVTFVTILFVVSLFSGFKLIFFIVLIIWGVLSWAISPPQQAYLIETSPKTADIQQSIHNSALQVGIALGSGVGSLIIKVTDTVTYNSWVAFIMLVFALGLSLFSISRKMSV